MTNKSRLDEEDYLYAVFVVDEKDDGAIKRSVILKDLKEAKSLLADIRNTYPNAELRRLNCNHWELFKED